MDRKQEKFKILKFGGTSLGTVERIKHVANLICNNELNLVVLSAMSGTTNSLAKIASLLFNGDIDGAQRDIKCLEIKYIEVADKLYLSAKSIEEAKKFILDNLKEAIEQASKSVGQKDYKTVLQEKLQKHGTVHIEYSIIKEEGPDHDKTFVAEVKCNGKQLAVGQGNTKKQAEMEAARVALEK